MPKFDLTSGEFKTFFGHSSDYSKPRWNESGDTVGAQRTTIQDRVAMPGFPASLPSGVHGNTHTIVLRGRYEIYESF